MTAFLVEQGGECDFGLFTTKFNVKKKALQAHFAFEQTETAGKMLIMTKDMEAMKKQENAAKEPEDAAAQNLGWWKGSWDSGNGWWKGSWRRSDKECTWAGSRWGKNEGHDKQEQNEKDKQKEEKRTEDKRNMPPPEGLPSKKQKSMNLDDCPYASLGLGPKALQAEVVIASERALLSAHPDKTDVGGDPQLN